MSTQRSTRARKVSQRMAVVDDYTRQQANQARLDALENDEVVEAFGADNEDDEFVLELEEDDEELSGKKSKNKKGVGSKRKTRGQLACRKGPKTFVQVLEESTVEKVPPTVPTYFTAAAASPAGVSRKFCSVCGVFSSYTCARCGAKYCCRKCYTIHVDTRCLKFMA